MLAQSPSVNSLCAALLILRLHSVSAAPRSPLCSRLCLRSDGFNIVWPGVRHVFFGGGGVVLVSTWCSCEIWSSFHPIYCWQQKHFCVGYIPARGGWRACYWSMTVISGEIYSDTKCSADNKREGAEYLSAYVTETPWISRVLFLIIRGSVYPWLPGLQLTILNPSLIVAASVKLSFSNINRGVYTSSNS